VIDWASSCCVCTCQRLAQGEQSKNFAAPGLNALTDQSGRLISATKTLWLLKKPARSTSPRYVFACPAPCPACRGALPDRSARGSLLSKPRFWMCPITSNKILSKLRPARPHDLEPEVLTGLLWRSLGGKRRSRPRRSSRRSSRICRLRWILSMFDLAPASSSSSCPCGMFAQFPTAVDKVQF